MGELLEARRWKSTQEFAEGSSTLKHRSDLRFQFRTIHGHSGSLEIVLHRETRRIEFLQGCGKMLIQGRFFTAVAAQLSLNS
jgi:hypothetical protein